MAEFPTLDVIFVLSGKTNRNMKISDAAYISGEILSYLWNEPLWLHELPQASRDACRLISEANPALRQSIQEANHVNEGNVVEMCALWIARHGETIDLKPLSHRKAH